MKKYNIDVQDLINLLKSCGYNVEYDCDRCGEQYSFEVGGKETLYYQDLKIS